MLQALWLFSFVPSQQQASNSASLSSATGHWPRPFPNSCISLSTLDRQTLCLCALMLTQPPWGLEHQLSSPHPQKKFSMLWYMLACTCDTRENSDKEAKTATTFMEGRWPGISPRAGNIWAESWRLEMALVGIVQALPSLCHLGQSTNGPSPII